MLFDSAPLPHGEHSLVVHADIPVVAFDYAIYTTEDETLTPGGSGNKGSGRHSRVDAAVGAALGLLVLILALIWCFCRFRRRLDILVPARNRCIRDGPLTPFYGDSNPNRNPFDDKVNPFDDDEKVIAVPVLEGVEIVRAGPSGEKSAGASRADVHGDQQSPGEPSPRSENTAYFRAELERVLVEHERVLVENEMLRQAADPPRYSDGSQRLHVDT
ncbi:hypothetical protein AURDEDRAFT_164332 [Auricularia subglabra TFB-10046 SS5]|nr:hypothetical protein AURDEDRAFT_164332 [Auricularia subglabra TFB-10046 SS5]